MKKRKREKKLQLKLQKKLKTNIQTAAIEKRKPKNKITVFGIAAWKVVVGVGVIVSIVTGYFSLRTETKSQREKFDEEKFVDGYIEPLKLSTDTASFENSHTLSTTPVIDSLKRGKAIPNIDTLKGIYIKDFYSKNIYFQIGGRGVLTNPLYFKNGWDGFSALKKKISTTLMFIVKDDKLYVSAEFKDLQKEETIGIIEYNHWKLRRENMFDWKDTDSSLTVWDKQHNVVLSIMYLTRTKKNTERVIVKGYFIAPEAIVILNDNPYLQNVYYKSENQWKEKASYDINKISPVF